MLKRKWQKKVAVAALMVMAMAVALMLLAPWPPPGEPAERIVRPTPMPTPAEFIGPIARTAARIVHFPKMKFLEGRYIVVDVSEQRLYEMEGETVTAKPMKVSTGAGNSTPIGTFSIVRRWAGKHESSLYPGGHMWDTLYFAPKIGIHGTAESLYPKLGTPDSHGCVRVRQDQAKHLFDKYPNGTPVVVQV